MLGGRGRAAVPQFAVSVKEGSVSDHINNTDRDVIAKFTWRNNAPVSWDDDDSTTTMRCNVRGREGGCFERAKSAYSFFCDISYVMEQFA